MKIENQTAIIGFIFGFAIGIVLMWFVNYDKCLKNAIHELEMQEQHELNTY
jgi:uncharacterized membrane-anchored protein YhcB (DUF1043 family)